MRCQLFALQLLAVLYATALIQRKPFSVPITATLRLHQHNNNHNHVAFIVDGNGRWGVENNMTRMEGHSRGAANTVEIVKRGFQLGVGTISLYLFSTENWKRPQEEVLNIFELLERYLREFSGYLAENKVKVEVVGQTSRFPKPLQDLLQNVGYNGKADEEEGVTRLVLCLSYGGRDDIVSAAKLLACKVASGQLTADEIDEEIFSSQLSTGLRGLPDPDIVVRTSGAFRISNFMLFQTAYSEFVKIDCKWPDFKPDQLEAVLASINSRKRTYGGL